MDYKWALKKQVEHIRSVELAFSNMDIGALSSSDWPKVKEPKSLPVVSARLTRTFIKEGVAVMGVDSKRNRHHLQGPALTLDLTEPSDRDLLWKWLQQRGLHPHGSPVRHGFKGARNKKQKHAERQG